MKIRGFDWDEGNRKKCQKHGVSIEEIEAFFRSGNFKVAPDLKHSAEEKRYFAIGRGINGRALLAVYVERNERIRPLSVRYMHQKEWKSYEEKDPAF